MRLVIAFDFDDTLVCSKTDEHIPQGSLWDREARLTECQQNEKGESPLTVLAMPMSGESVETLQYPLAVGMMRNFVFALNDNYPMMGRSVFIVVITNGRYTPEAIRRFFMEAYGASQTVASSIRVVSRYSLADRGLQYESYRGRALERFRAFLNSSSNNTQHSASKAFDLWSFIRPEMVYLFDDSSDNLLEAKSMGFNAINARTPAFFNHLHLLVNIIRSNSFFEREMPAGYDEMKTLESDGWAVI